MKNIAYIVSFVNKSISFEWIVDSLNKNKFNLTFILLNNRDSSLEQFLLERKIDVYRVNYFGKKNIPTDASKLSELKKIRDQSYFLTKEDESFRGWNLASFDIRKLIN